MWFQWLWEKWLVRSWCSWLVVLVFRGRGLGDLCGRVPEGGADFVNVDLQCLLRALGALERMLFKPADDDDTGTLAQGGSKILSGLPPERAAQKQGFSVSPLLAVPVEEPWCCRNSKVS